MLDTTSPHDYDVMPWTATLAMYCSTGIEKYLQETGLKRLNTPLQINEEIEYTKEEREHIQKFNNHLWNSTFIDSVWRMHENILEVGAMEFPDVVPVLLINAKSTLEIAGEDRKIKKLERLGSHTESLVLEGHHGDFYTMKMNCKEILKTVTVFLHGK